MASDIYFIYLLLFRFLPVQCKHNENCSIMFALTDK